MMSPIYSCSSSISSPPNVSMPTNWKASTTLSISKPIFTNRLMRFLLYPWYLYKCRLVRHGMMVGVSRSVGEWRHATRMKWVGCYQSYRLSSTALGVGAGSARVFACWNLGLGGALAWSTAHSWAFLLKASGSLIIILATSASWGSFGSGLSKSDCSDNKVDLIVSTGDQAVLRVSRQIAPCFPALLMWMGSFRGRGTTYGLTADVGMPNFGIELHNRRAEGVFGWDLHVNDIAPPFVRRARRTKDASLEVCQVIATLGRLGRYIRVGNIDTHVAQLFGNTAHSAGRHRG